MDVLEGPAPAQGRIVRRRDLLRSGLSRRELARRVASGALRPLSPHLYTDAPAPLPDEQLRALAVGLGAVVSHTDAALLRGIELVQTPTERTVTVGRNRSGKVQAGVRVRRADLSEDDVEQRDGVPLTSAVRTVLDLCRTLPLAHAVASADSALRQRLVTLAALRAALCALPAGRGRTQVARVLALVDPACGSVLESLLRVLLAQHGLRPPSTQLEVFAASAGLIGRVDFAWPELRLVVEADGFAFHSDRRSYRADRRRCNALVREGWAVLRFSWEDVTLLPEYVVETVRALVEAGSHAA